MDDDGFPGVGGILAPTSEAERALWASWAKPKEEPTSEKMKPGSLLDVLSDDIQDDCSCITEGPYDGAGETIAYLNGESFELILSTCRFNIPMRKEPIIEQTVADLFLFLDTLSEDLLSSNHNDHSIVDDSRFRHRYFLSNPFLFGRKVRNLEYHGLFVILSSVTRKSRKF